MDRGCSSVDVIVGLGVLVAVTLLAVAVALVVAVLVAVAVDRCPAVALARRVGEGVAVDCALSYTPATGCARGVAPVVSCCKALPPTGRWLQADPTATITIRSNQGKKADSRLT